ncbi:LOW QUALITY PROTEIN: mortality factor 4-like protein 1 [Phascolarctos cinereus]|uniref:LOW QUALITY PROTEIN: mortality factor 4-like protein 2 n=1 Tax=Phascolarctos cinereus TaxID=38626 RepID=A0A6P5JF87_PHACI|nr:LOW QUALITY PROTEIN: mortality factor 4-like protein 2 [Phascolarctos cinereus]
MASSEPEGRPVRSLPFFLEGEAVLTFQGPKMRVAQCIWVAVENNQVKYLVCYPSESTSSPARRGAVAYPSAHLWWPPLSPTGPAPGGPRFWSNHSGSQGRAMPLGAPSESSYRRSITLGRGDSSLRNLDPLPVVPKMFSKEPLYPVAPFGWDYEWIPEGSVLRYSAAYMERDRYAYVLLQIAAERKQHGERPVTASWGSDHCNPSEGGIAGGSAAQQPSPSPEIVRACAQGRGNRPWRDGDATTEPEKKSLGRQEVQVHLPMVLRSLLIQDWELVTLEKKLFIVPARKTVAAILIEYATFQPNHHSSDKKCAISGLVALIKEYFDMVLGTQLLYSFERPQYAEVLAHYPTCQMSRIYGGIHLLRLLPQMGSVPACSPLNEGSLNVLMSHLQDFLEYLAGDPSQLFTAATDYQVASAEYQQKAN